MTTPNTNSDNANFNETTPLNVNHVGGNNASSSSSSSSNSTTTTTTTSTTTTAGGSSTNTTNPLMISGSVSSLLGSTSSFTGYSPPSSNPTSPTPKRQTNFSIMPSSSITSFMQSGLPPVSTTISPTQTGEENALDGSMGGGQPLPKVPRPSFKNLLIPSNSMKKLPGLSQDARTSVQAVPSPSFVETSSFMYPGGGFGPAASMLHDPWAYASGYFNGLPSKGNMPQPLGSPPTDRDSESDLEGASSGRYNQFDEVYVFLLRMTLALHNFGAPVHKTEYNIKLLIERFALDAAVSVLPTLIMVSFGNFEDNASRTQFIPFIPQGLDGRKLQRLDELCDDVITGTVDFHTATQRLDAIVNLSADVFPIWIQLLAFAMASMGLVGLFYNGGWRDLLASGILGTLTGVLCYLCKFSPFLGRIIEAIASLIIALLAGLCNLYIMPICVLGVSITAVSWLLPGLSITIAVSELAARSLISGTVKLFFSLIIAVELGYGLAIGERLASYLTFNEGDTIGTCSLSSPFPVWMGLLFFFISSVSFSLLSRTEPSQWPAMIISSFGAVSCYQVCSKLLSMNYDLATVVSSVIVGILANLFSKKTKATTVIPLISGILLLVPGSIGVKGVRAMMTEDFVSGMAFGFQMVVVAVSITVGVFVSNLIVPPQRIARDYLS